MGHANPSLGEIIAFLPSSGAFNGLRVWENPCREKSRLPHKRSKSPCGPKVIPRGVGVVRMCNGLSVKYGVTFAPTLEPSLASLLFWLFWLCDYGFFRLTKVLTIDDWEGRLVAEVHSVTTTLAFAVLGILFALDVIEIRRRPH